VPLEFRDGVRSWFVPGAIGVVMKLGAALGIHSGLGLVRLVKTCIALGTVAGGYAAIRIAERLAGVRAALLAGALHAASPIVVYFGSRAFTDTISMPIVAFGALMLTRRRRAAPQAFGAGLLFGLAAVIRYQNLLLVVVPLAALLAARSWRLAFRYALGAAVMLTLGGALDWITWGVPFAPLVDRLRVALRFLHFQSESAGLAGLGVEPASYYTTTYASVWGWPFYVVLAGFAIALFRARLLGALVVAFVATHVLIAHKEIRYLLPVVPIVIAMAAVGLVIVLDIVSRRRSAITSIVVVVLAGASAVTAAVKLSSATFESMGDAEFGAASAWHFDENQSVLFSSAGSHADACGVIYLGRSGTNWDHSGTYSYLHRDIPLFHARNGELARYANYVVAPRGARLPGEFEQIEIRGTYALYRRAGTCEPPPSWYSRESER